MRRDEGKTGHREGAMTPEGVRVYTPILSQPLPRPRMHMKQGCRLCPLLGRPGTGWHCGRLPLPYAAL